MRTGKLKSPAKCGWRYQVLAREARLRTSQRDAADEHEVLVGVDRRSVARVPFEAVVRAGRVAGRVAGRSDIADDVTGLDGAEAAEAGQMRVVREALLAVDAHAEPAQLAVGGGRHPVERSEDRRPTRGDDVVALVDVGPAPGS